MGCPELATDAGLKRLLGLPLTSLHLGSHPNALNKLLHWGLDSWETPTVTDSGLKALEGKALNELTLRGFPDIEDWGLRFLEGMPFTKLEISGCPQLSDATVAAVICGLPIVSLNISGCSGLTGGLLDVLLSLPNLAELVLYKCRLGLINACAGHEKLGRVLDRGNAEAMGYAN